MGAHSWADLISEDTGMKVIIGGDTNTRKPFSPGWAGRPFAADDCAPSETSQMIMADRKYAVRDGGLPGARSLMQSKGNAGFLHGRF